VLQDCIAVGLLGVRDIDGQADRRRIGVGQGIDSARKKLRKLPVEKRPNVRRVQETMHVVEEIACIGTRRDEIHQNYSTARTANSRHLGNGLPWIGEVMQRASAEHDVERLVEKGQGLRVRLLQQDVRDTRVTKPLRAHS